MSMCPAICVSIGISDFLSIPDPGASSASTTPLATAGLPHTPASA
jgi:hypothetical protein